MFQDYCEHKTLHTLITDYRLHSYLVSKFVVWWFREGDLWDIKLWSIIDDRQWLESMRSGVLDLSLAGSNGFISLSSKSLSMPVLGILNARKSTTYWHMVDGQKQNNERSSFSL